MNKERNFDNVRVALFIHAQAAGQEAVIYHRLLMRESRDPEVKSSFFSLLDLSSILNHFGAVLSVA